MQFLVQTPHPWRGIRQRSHHLMASFARRGHFVRWVESRYLRWLIDQPGNFWRARPEEPMDNLEVRPITLINGERLRAVRAHNQFWLARKLKNNLPASNGPRVLWIYNPHEGQLADRVPHDLLIYDIMDEYRGFPWSPRNIAAEEAELLQRADWVFAGTHALYEAKKDLASGRIECVLSGVDTGHFATTGSGKGATHDAAHAAMRGQFKKLAGYAGMIDERVDQELIRRAAQALPGVGFVFIGPAVADVSPLAVLPNVIFLGQRDYEDLPGYYHDWDAALLPFMDSELTRHINPTKLLEYAAAGTPVIARALPDVEKYYADGAWLYRTAEEFIGQLKRVLDDDDDGPPDDRAPKLTHARQWANDRDWETIAEKMLARLTQLTRS